MSDQLILFDAGAQVMQEISDTTRANDRLTVPDVLSGYEQFSMVSDQLFPMPRPTEIRDQEGAVDPFEVVGEQ